MVLFNSQTSFEDFKKTVEPLGNIYHHRDSNSDGYTFIKNRNMNTKGFKGFSNNFLSLHTDRSSVSTPPKLLATYFSKQSKYGGESNFVDVKDVYNYLNKNYKSELEMLLNIKCSFWDIKNENVIHHSILSLDEDILNVRYRSDSLISFPEKIIPIIDLWEETIKKFQFSFSFKTGNYYILDNRRFLHGRNSFEGEREIIRVLLD